MTEGALEELKAKHVVETFNEAVKQLQYRGLPPSNLRTIIRHAMSLGAPRFYVSFDKAARFVSLLHRGKSIPVKSPRRIALYTELHRRYEAFLKEHPSYEGNYSILREILQEPAPSFYISHKSFTQIRYSYYRMKRKKALERKRTIGNFGNINNRTCSWL